MPIKWNKSLISKLGNQTGIRFQYYKEIPKKNVLKKKLEVIMQLRV